MSALVSARMPIEYRFKNIALPFVDGDIAYQGGMACIDTADGVVKPGAAGNANLVRIGNFAETLDNSASTVSTPVLVALDHEVVCQWYDNATGANAADATDLFDNAYILDDHTVTMSSSGNSVAGRIWAVDSVKGVAVETTNL